MSSPVLAAPDRSHYPRALPRSQQIYLALPCYGAQMTRPFVSGLLESMLCSDVIGYIDFLDNDSLVCRARNKLAAQFLASEFEWLMFIDVDLAFTPEQLIRIWLHAIKEKRKIVGGLYAMKKISPQFVANWLPGEAPDATGAVKVSELGTGFLLIHRSVFETMREKMPEIAFTPDALPGTSHQPIGWDFFAVGPYADKTSGTTRYLSEDWMFCRRARDLGFDIWADTFVQISHIGVMSFPPSVPEIVDAVKTIRAKGHPQMPKDLL
jgi:hypothetical protein